MIPKYSYTDISDMATNHNGFKKVLAI